jgi:hypothetical protein
VIANPVVQMLLIVVLAVALGGAAWAFYKQVKG